MILCTFVVSVRPCIAGHEAERIAFVALTEHFWQVFLINEDGTGTRQLTTSGFDKTHLSWSTERDELLVNSNLGELFIVKTDTPSEKKISPGIRGMTDAVWSRDSQSVLFSLSIANSIDANDIFLVNLVSGSLKKLTSMKHLQHDPVWTEDERKVVFLSGAGGQNHDIWVLDLETRDMKQLTVGQRYHFEPACSSKDEIAFSSNRSGDYEIWVCDLEGKRFEQITHSPGLDAQPTWSPDGEKIAFVSNRTGKSAIWVVDRDGSHPRQLTPSHMVCRNPAWSR